MRKKLFLFILVSSYLMATGSISGLGYFNYNYDLTKDALNNGGFSLNRVYFTYKNDITDNLSVKFQTDVGEVGDDERLTAFLKKAQVDWKLSIGKISLGMQGMNMFNITEKTWGFRFIQKSPMDLHGFSSSADLGMGYSNKTGDLSYSILVTNGRGYKKQENDRFKKVSFHSVYGQPKLSKEDGYNVGIASSIEQYEDDLKFKFNKTVMSIFAGFSGYGLRIGGEFDMYRDSNADNKPEISNKQIIAFYGSYKLIDNIEGLVYVDMFDPDINAEDDGETYIIAGLNYYATKGLVIAPNVQMTSFSNSDTDNLTNFIMNFQFKF